MGRWLAWVMVGIVASALFSSRLEAGTRQLVAGKLSVEGTCKLKLNDFKLQVVALTSVDYLRPQAISVAENGEFNVKLIDSYNYRFQVLIRGSIPEQVTATARYEPLVPEKFSVIVAKCPVVEKSDDKKAATPT